MVKFEREPLEWVEVDPSLLAAPSSTVESDSDQGTAGREFLLTKRFAQGPPIESGTADAPITWVFEPGSFRKISSPGVVSAQLPQS